MIVASLCEVGVVELDIDKMPLPGASVPLSSAVSIRVPVFVRPRCFAGDIVRGEAVRIAPPQLPLEGQHNAQATRVVSASSLPVLAS